MRNEDLIINNNMIQFIPAVGIQCSKPIRFQMKRTGDFLNYPNKRGFHCGRWLPFKQKTMEKNKLNLR